MKTNGIGPGVCIEGVGGPVLKHLCSVLEDDEDSIDEKDNQGEEDQLDTSAFKSLPNNQFLSINAAYQIVSTSTQKDFVNDIPPGPKENVFVVVQRSMEGKFDFPDDCSMRGRVGTTVNSTSIAKENTLKRQLSLRITVFTSKIKVLNTDRRWRKGTCLLICNTFP